MLNIYSSKYDMNINVVVYQPKYIGYNTKVLYRHFAALHT